MRALHFLFLNRRIFGQINMINPTSDSVTVDLLFAVAPITTCGYQIQETLRRTRLGSVLISF